MKKSCTDEFSEEQVGAVSDGDLHGLIKARPRVEHDEAVRRRSQDAVQRGRSILQSARKGA